MTFVFYSVYVFCSNLYSNYEAKRNSMLSIFLRTLSVGICYAHCLKAINLIVKRPSMLCLKYMTDEISQIIDFMTLAGDPAATLFGGISFVTTEFAPIIEEFPIRTPGITATPSPSQTSSSIITGPFD